MHSIMFFLADLLRTYADEDFHAFIICLLLAKDGFISRKNISDLINFLNNIRVSLSLDPLAKCPDSVNLRQYLNNDTRHFICSRHGRISLISQNAMDSVVLLLRIFSNSKRFRLIFSLWTGGFLDDTVELQGTKKRKTNFVFISVHVRLSSFYFAWDLVLLIIQFWRIKQHTQLFVRDVRKQDFLAFW